MEKNAAKEYLIAIAELAADGIHEAAVTDTDDGAVLLLTAGSPFGEEDELSYTVSVEDYAEGLFIFQVMIFSFKDIPQERFGELGTVINALNARITLGGFVLFEEESTVFFNHSFLLDETAETAAAARILLKSIGLMENAVANAGIWIKRLLEGELTAEAVLKALGEEE